MTEAPKSWKLEKESSSELIWVHKHGATIYLRGGPYTSWLLTFHDPRKGGIGNTEGKFRKGQKEAAQQLAIEYMERHP